MNTKLFTVARSRKVLGLLAATLLVAGCGTKQDPASDYPELKDSVPVHPVPAQKQNVETPAQGVLPANVFQVEMPGNMNFVEGQSATYDIAVTTLLHDITFALAATGLPNGISLVRMSATHYQVSGTVPVGSSAGLPQGQKIPVVIDAVNAKGEQNELKLFSTLLHSWTPTVRVFATDKQPIVEAQNISGLTVNEGDSLPISIIVSDVGSHGSQVPQIQSPFQDDIQNGEVAFVSAMPGLRISRTPEALGAGRFKFSGTLNTKLLTLPAGKKNVTARFVVNFKSPSSLISADEIIDVKVVRTIPAPVAVAPAAAAPAAPVAKAAAPAAAAAAPAAPAPAAKAVAVAEKNPVQAPAQKQETK
jgi:hypothetical protein